MYWLNIYLALFSLWHVAVTLIAQGPMSYGRCSSHGIPQPYPLGVQITSLSAYERHNYSIDHKNLTKLSFCNVNITYTHLGTNDSINVQVWLPISGWNMRFQGTGGSGYATGTFDSSLAPAVAQGYSAASTDGGHPTSHREQVSAETWALISTGKVNHQLLLDFASVALDDMTFLGKAVTESYYGTPPRYSYWNGCSTGGRQGLLQAQRYPKNYDGILAASPAINWPSFIVAEWWGQLNMNQLDNYPRQCEFEAITAAAIEACDALDGLTDGIIAAPSLCHFNPYSLVGDSFSCSGVIKKFSSAAATVAQKVWQGARSTNGSFLWYGLHQDASFAGLVNTVCAANGICTAAPFQISEDWIRLFVEKNSSFDIDHVSFNDYDDIFRKSNNQYQSIIGTNDADLSAFRDAGGKMITWQGLADHLIFPNGTVQYYERVRAADPGVQDYYRLFEAPGVGHCAAGVGPFPSGALQSLVDWVEQGIAPETLLGTSLPDANGKVKRQPLCAFPLVSKYKGGDPLLESSFECASSFT